MLGVAQDFMRVREPDGGEETVSCSRTGVPPVDSNRHIVSVKTSAGPPIVPEEGSTIIGVVEKVQDKMAIINIIVVDGHKLQPPFTGMLHISNSSPRFERFMGDVCKPNDIVRGKVIDVSQRIPKLTTVGRDMGAIKAYCSRCGGELVLSGRILRCTLCLNVERRRLAEDFGAGGNMPS